MEGVSGLSNPLAFTCSGSMSPLGSNYAGSYEASELAKAGLFATGRQRFGCLVAAGNNTPTFQPGSSPKREAAVKRAFHVRIRSSVVAQDMGTRFEN